MGSRKVLLFVLHLWTSTPMSSPPNTSTAASTERLVMAASRQASDGAGGTRGHFSHDGVLGYCKQEEQGKHSSMSGFHTSDGLQEFCVFTPLMLVATTRMIPQNAQNIVFVSIAL